MNLRCIAQTAAILGRFGNKWDQSSGLSNESETTEFLKNSRVLFSIWSKEIQGFRRNGASLLTLSQLAEEVLVSELLTRTMAAELLVLGERTCSPEPTKIAFKTMSDHHRCRQQLFELIERQPNGVSTFLRCQRLGRKIERWTDLLISPMTGAESATHASYNEERCLDFGDQWSREKSYSESCGSFQIQLASLTVAIPNVEIVNAASLAAHNARSTAALSFVAPERPLPLSGVHVGRLCNQVGNGNQITTKMFSGLN